MLKLKVKLTCESNIQWQHKKVNTARYSAWYLKNLCICQKIQLRLWVQVFKYLPKRLLHISSKSCCNFTWWFKEGHSWTIVFTWLRSVLSLHATTSSPNVYWRKQLNRLAHLEICHRNPDILEKVLNWIALSNSINELWLIANYSNSFEDGSKSILRNNLG